MRVPHPSTLLAVLAIVLLLVPPTAADHPGSNLGLARYSGHEQNLVHRVTDVDADFSRFEAEHAELVDRMTLGTSGVLGLPLYALRLTDESVPFEDADLQTGQKLRIYLDGGHHGNEFLGVDLVMYYLEELLTKADEGDEATWAFLRTHELYAAPIINPEGNALDTRKNGNQVDPNRNYGYEWGGPGSGSFIFEFNYRGEAPFSEPEVAANAEFARTIMPDLWITMHTGVAEFYWPWGWTYDKSPDWEFFESIERPFEEATNGRVDAMMAAELYLAAGATDDWGYGQLGVPTHTFEVHEDQFVPVYGEAIPAVIADQLTGLDWVIQNTRTWGAWLEMHAEDGQLHVRNVGWAKAQNATLEYGGKVTTLQALAPGESVQVLLAEGPATLSYRQLLIDAPEAKTRVATFHPEAGAAPAVGVPGLSLVALLAVVAALAGLRRRA